MALKADPTTPQVAKKAAVIDEIKHRLQGADAAVLTEYRGLTVTEIAHLRAALRPAGTEYKIYKNTLVKRAADEIGIGGVLAELLTGPVAIAFVSGDAAAAAKALRDFARTNQHLVLKGGLLGERHLAPADVDALAELPSREVLLSQIAGLFEAPLSQTLGLFEAVLRDTVGLVQALIDQRVEGGEAPPPAAATDPGAPDTSAAAEVSEQANNAAEPGPDEPGPDEPGPDGSAAATEPDATAGDAGEQSGD